MSRWTITSQSQGKTLIQAKVTQYRLVFEKLQRFWIMTNIFKKNLSAASDNTYFYLRCQGRQSFFPVPRSSSLVKVDLEIQKEIFSLPLAILHLFGYIQGHSNEWASRKWLSIRSVFASFYWSVAKTKTHQGLASLDFAQLGPVHPSGPPYFHLVYTTTKKNLLFFLARRSRTRTQIPKKIHSGSWCYCMVQALTETGLLSCLRCAQGWSCL